MDSLLSVGEWSTRGCSRNATASNDSVTVCECNHLTHFAILLSADPVPLPAPITLSLKVIGYVGVGVSLVAMTLTVLTFIALKYVSSCTLTCPLMGCVGILSKMKISQNSPKVLIGLYESVVVRAIHASVCL